jgi:hypothetical protein
MNRYVVGPYADLVTLEKAVWLLNLRYVATTYWNGEVKNVLTGEKHNVADLTDEELNNREAFPLFGYKGATVNSESGFTYRWDVPHEVTKADSPYLGSYFMPLPEAISESLARVLAVYQQVAASIPTITEIETTQADFVEPVEDILA